MQRLRKELDELAARQAEIEREAGNLAAQLKPLKLLEDKLAAHNAVSYTHLDVYKRQILPGARPLWGWISRCARGC